MMETAFGKSTDNLSTKSSNGAYEDDDLLQIPFSATKLRHSLSEGSRPVHKPVNGYNRMHSFHSTLADDDWKEDVSLENSKSDARFLPADFTEALLKDFPRLHKNGYQSHSFDEDIFDEAAEKFSTGFFSESEIDDIPRSSLFHRAGLRRSTSHVEPQRVASRQDWKPDTAVRKSDENSSRKAKIEELLRLKKQLEELKSWQANSDQRSRDTRKDTMQEKEKETSKDDVEDVLESRLKVIKEKGKMKRRRLSTSKRTNSLSSKLMEELLEEEEEIPADSETTTPEKVTGKTSGKCRTRSSSDIDDNVSPSSSLRRESLDESFKLADKLGTKSWQEDFLFNRHEDFSVRKKSLEKPHGERKLSLNMNDAASSPARNGGDFRRSYSTSFDMNGIDRDLRESLQRRASKHTEKDDIGRGCDVTNARWKSQRHDGGLTRDDKQKDACSFYPEGVSSSLMSNSLKTSFDLRKERDRSQKDLQQNRKSQERNGKQSLLHDRYGMDDIFKKFTFRGVPRMDFFEHESFARDDRRKKLMEEIGGIQRHLADITKYELRGRRQRPKQVDKDHEVPLKQEVGELGTRRSSSVVDLQAERSSLINHLKELLCQKQEREEEIRKKLDQSKKEESPDSTEKEKDEMSSDILTKEEYKDKDKITGCEENKSKETIQPCQRLDDEDEVSFILRSAGAEHYIPITKKNEVTIDKLYQFMPADFAELGITNPDLQQRLQEEIDKHFVEQKNAQLKAAELESTKEGHKSKFSECGGGASGACSGSSTPSTPIVDAPEGYEPDVPVHVSAECVVCLDRQSNLLFLNCGHVCCCYDCSVDLNLCPLCRAEIAAKLIMNDSLPE